MTRLLGIVFLGLTLAVAGCATGGSTTGKGGSKDPALINAQLAIGYMRDGKNELALEKFKRAIEQDDDLALAHIGVAELYDRIGETRKAMEHHERAIELEPDNASAHNNFGQFLCRQGDYERAYKHFDEATDISLYGRKYIPYTNAGMCAVRADDTQKAEEYFRQALEQNPEYARALYQMAKLNYESGEALQARGFLQRYDAVHRPTPDSLWLGIQIERELGDKDALASYSLLLKRNFPDSEEARKLKQTGTRVE